MKLLTKDILKKLPPLYGTEEIPLEEKKVIVKFFGGSSASFYGIEFDPAEGLFWGWVNLGDREMAEFGYFSLPELQTIRFKPFGLPVERDLYWSSDTPMKDVLSGKIT